MWQYCLTPDEKNVLVSKKKNKKKDLFLNIKDSGVYTSSIVTI